MMALIDNAGGGFASHPVGSCLSFSVAAIVPGSKQTDSEGSATQTQSKRVFRASNWLRVAINIKLLSVTDWQQFLPDALPEWGDMNLNEYN